MPLIQILTKKELILCLNPLAEKLLLPDEKLLPKKGKNPLWRLERNAQRQESKKLISLKLTG